MNQIQKFIAVGENIHCTRIFKVGGKFVTSRAENVHVISYTLDGKMHDVPIPQHVVDSEDWAKGKVKHAAVAMWQGFYGDDAAKQAGIAYLEYMARVQESYGASFLDINVDEFSNDVEERVRLMQWVVGVLQKASSAPLSIDSSDLNILRAGLEACDPSRGKPMVNSVSLERAAGIEIAREHGAVVVAGATGEHSMPQNAAERAQNLERLVKKLHEAGFEDGDIYLDPLVFPASVDSKNGGMILEAIKTLRATFGEAIHFAPGLSNVSYGLPNRKLLNQVFTYLCVEQGCDGGIVDPRHINDDVLNSLDTTSEAFQLAKAFLVGEDEYGMNYIRAARKGKI